MGAAARSEFNFSLKRLCVEVRIVWVNTPNYMPQRDSSR
jgi:hypothetical protein